MRFVLGRLSDVALGFPFALLTSLLFLIFIFSANLAALRLLTSSVHAPPAHFDRFAQFFTTPLFTEGATDRELRAVDSGALST